MEQYSYKFARTCVSDLHISVVDDLTFNSINVVTECDDDFEDGNLNL
jgi:hypothetical protein